METNKAPKPANIERQENHDCQQFFGPVSGCVFAMPGSHVTMPSEKPSHQQFDAAVPQPDEELFRFIHPSVTDEKERIKIHQEVKNLVRGYPIPEIFKHLNTMAEKERIYYKTINHATFREELERLGLPDDSQPNYSAKTFDKHFK